MLGNQEESKIYINKKSKPSDFMLDLASMAKEQESIVEEQEKNVGFINKSQNKLKKAFQRKKRKKPSHAKRDLKFSYEDKVFEDSDVHDHDNGEIKSEQTKKEKKIFVPVSQLAFFRMLKSMVFMCLAFVVFAKRTCFKIGWLFVFFFRFVYFLIARFFGIFSEFTRLNTRKGIREEKYEQISPLLSQDIMDPALLAEDNDIAPEIVLDETDELMKNNNLIFQKTITQDRLIQKNSTSSNESYCPLKQAPLLENTIGIKNNFFSFIFRPNLSHFRTAVYFAVFMLILILPFKVLTYYSVLQDLGGKVLGVSEDAIGDFKDAGTAASDLDFYKAGEQFAEASDGFLRAQEEMDSISGQLRVLSSIIPSHKLGLAADAKYILEAGKISAKIGQQISFTFDTFTSKKDKSIKTVFDDFSSNIGPLQENTNRLYEVLLKIDSKNLPENKRVTFENLRDKTGQIKNSFAELADLLEKMKIFLGFDKDKRYLLIFQNNSEMRASGGFMGSFSIVDFRDGEIINIETPRGGTYDTEGGFLDNIVAPEPLRIVNPSWHFWDANWWPDWKKTSKKLEWFYEHSGGSSVDGVIGITPVVVERLLKIMGPLDMEDSHGVTITAENFWEITQTFAEQKPINHPAYEPLPFTPKGNEGSDVGLEGEKTEDIKDAGLEPKKIIGDLIDEIKTELPKRLNKNIFLSLVASLEQSLSEKHVLFYFNDYILQNKFEELGWAGRIRKTNWDYLMVVNSNISGAKSDRKIEQEINHQSEVLDDGTIVNTLRITRTHTGIKGEKFTGVKNLDWMRIYLPLGSQFIEATGFWPPDQSLFEKPNPNWRHDPDLKNSEENFIRDSKSWTKIYNEGDKTVFANWVQVDPGKSVEVVIKYILPFKLIVDQDASRPFALLAEKQPGAEPCKISSRLILPEKLQVDWKYPDDLKTQQNGWFIEDVLSRDKFWAILVKE